MINKENNNSCNSTQADNLKKILSNNLNNDEEFVCYCSKVTEEDIKNAILNKNAKTAQEVIEITEAMQNCNCKINNPKGICCYNDIVKTVSKYLKN